MAHRAAPRWSSRRAAKRHIADRKGVSLLVVRAGADRRIITLLPALSFEAEPAESRPNWRDHQQERNQPEIGGARNIAPHCDLVTHAARVGRHLRLHTQIVTPGGHGWYGSGIAAVAFSPCSVTISASVVADLTGE